MYSSISNCSHNPISFPGQVFQHRPLYNSDINPNSKWEDPPFASLFRLPSPCMQYEDAVNELTWQQLHDLFVQQQPFTAETVTNMADLNKEAVNELKEDWNKKCAAINEQFPKKRSSKKDRHSKINTAQGPRDRRMRLSLDVARKFFDLQDMLGFDKASRTVEWLLMQSSSAIKEIMRGLPRMRRQISCSIGANSVSSTSECEVVSGIDEWTTNENQKGSISIKVKIKSSCNKEKKARVARRTAFPPLARESRKIARERARKRTIEKRRLSESKSCIEAQVHDSNRLGLLSRLGRGEESGTQGPHINPSYGVLTEMEELSSHDRQLVDAREYIGDDSLIITGNWNASAICNYQQNPEISHEHQFSEFPFCGKPWEACSIKSLGG